MNILSRSILLVLWTLCGCVLPAHALTFTDTDFDLSRYQVSPYTSPGQTLTVTQAPSQGNPGAALEIHALLAPPGFSNATSRVLVLGDTLRYDPATSGALQSLDWQMDKWITIVQPVGLGLFSGVTLLLEQQGRFFINTVVLPATTDTWHTGVASGLTAQSFVELTDPLQGVVDPLSHPSFTQGAMRFGLSASFGAAAGSPTIEVIGRYDNLVLNLSPVPEPAAPLLWLAGAAMLLSRARRTAAPAPRAP